MDAEAIAKANREMIAERTAILAELNAAKLTIAQRSVDTVGEWADGVDQLITQARRGDRAARELLRRIGRQIKAIENYDSPLELPASIR